MPRNWSMSRYRNTRFWNGVFNTKPFWLFEFRNSLQCCQFIRQCNGQYISVCENRRKFMLKLFSFLTSSSVNYLPTFLLRPVCRFAECSRSTLLLLNEKFVCDFDGTESEKEGAKTGHGTIVKLITLEATTVGLMLFTS